MAGANEIKFGILIGATDKASIPMRGVGNAVSQVANTTKAFASTAKASMATANQAVSAFVDRSPPLRATAEVFRMVGDRAVSAASRVQSGMNTAAAAVSRFASNGSNKLKQAGKDAEELGEKFASVAESMRVGRENLDAFAQKGQEAIQSIIEPTLQSEGVVLRLRETLGDVTTDVEGAFGRIDDAATQSAQAHSHSANDYRAAAAVMVRATRNEELALRSTGAAMAFASANQLDAAAGATTLNRLYDLAGDKTGDYANEVSRLGDILTRTRQIYGDAFKPEEIADPLKDAGAAARDARLPLEQMVGAIGAFQAAGILGGEAGAATKNVLENLQAASDKVGFTILRTKDGGLDLAATLREIRDGWGDTTEMSQFALDSFSEAFGPAWRDVSLLINQADRLESQWGAIGDAAGAAAAGQRAFDDSATGQLAQFNNELTALKGDLAGAVLPALREMKPVVMAVVKPLGEFAKAHPDLVGTAATWGVMAVGAAKAGSAVATVAGSVASVGQGALFAGRLATSFGASALTMGASVMGTVVPALGAAATGAATFAAALLANPITWIVLAIVAAAALIYVYWDPIVNFFTGIWSSIKGAFQEGFVTGVLKVIELFNPLVWIANGMNAVSEYLFGFSLFDAGANIVNTVWSGIKSMASKPVEAFRDMASQIRDHLPFSPAKRGPLRDLHKVKLVETVAQAVNPTPLVDAMRGAAGQAMNAMTTAPMTHFAPVPFGAAGGLNTTNTTAATVGDVHLHLEGGRDAVDALEAWLRDPDSGRRLAGAVQTFQQRSARAEYS